MRPCHQEAFEIVYLTVLWLQILPRMNPNVSACDEFREFACGQWFQTQQLPVGRSEWSLKRQLEYKSEYSQPTLLQIHSRHSSHIHLQSHSLCIFKFPMENWILVFCGGTPTAILIWQVSLGFSSDVQTSQPCHVWPSVMPQYICCFKFYTQHHFGKIV